MTIKKAYADTPFGQMHYRTIPGSGIPLVLYHRTPATSVCFEPMMQMMAGERPLYAFDTPGFGESFTPEGYPSAADYGQMYLAGLDALELNKVHIFAHHTGTHFASEMALAAPQRVASLTLNGIAYLTADERADFKTIVGHALPPAADMAYVQETWDIVCSLFPTFDPDLTHKEFVSAVRSGVGRNKAHDAIWAQDYPAVFERLTVSLLAMCAEDDTLRPFFDRALKARPDMRSVITGAAKYFSPEYDTEATVSAIRYFIADVEAELT